MTPENRLDVAVYARHTDGIWHYGFLEHWRRDGDGWEGLVRYSVEAGAQYVLWLRYPEAIRKVAHPGAEAPQHVPPCPIRATRRRALSGFGEDHLTS